MIAPIVVPSPLCDFPRKQHGSTLEAMPDHERGGCPPLLGKRQELLREVATDISFKRHKVRSKEAV